MKKGIKARFHDAKEMLKFNPDVYEFHFSDKDLDHDFGNQSYTQELVVHGPEYWEQKLLDPASTGEQPRQHSREKSVEIIQKALNKTNEIAECFQGRPKFVLHPGGMSLDRVKDTKPMLEALKKTMMELEPGNAIILLENMPPFPWFFGGQWCCNIFLDSNEIIKFLDSIKHPFMTFDLCHSQLYCNWAKKDIVKEIEKLNPYITHVHISDADGEAGEGLQIEEGMVDFNKTLGKIRQDVTMIPEIWQGHLNNHEGFKTAFDRLKKYKVYKK